MQGNTILLKQDNGSYQLLRISTQPGNQVTQVAPGLTPTAGNTIRLQTVPASVSRSFPGPTLALRKTIITQQVKQNKQNVNSHCQLVCFFLYLSLSHCFINEMAKMIYLTFFFSIFMFLSIIFFWRQKSLATFMLIKYIVI
jgi:hypothetical protein